MDADFLSDELLAELRQSAKLAAQGARDPEVMRKAHERMVAMRDEIYRKHGLLDIGVPALREFRAGKDA